MTAFYWVIKGIAWPVLRGYLRFRRHDKGRVPAAGACIVVANHTSYLDATCLGSACPRRLNFLISDDIYRLRRLTWFYYLMGAIPVKTESADLKALKRALDVLKEGGGVGIFPEGQRMKDGSIGQGKTGVAFLAAKSGAPVIPAAIVGAHHSMPVGALFPRPRRVRVFFGEPMRFAGNGGKASKEDLAAFANQIMDAIASLARASGDRRTAGPSAPPSPEAGR